MTRMVDHPVMILDRMTMAHGLEARSPFLDHKLAEFCAKIPTSYKVKGRELRYIQYKLAKKYLPDEIIRKKKQGFASPLVYILNDEFRLLYETFLNDSFLVNDGFLEGRPIKNMLDEQMGKIKDHGQRLWQICNMEIWYRMNIKGLKKEELTNILGKLH
jgi:asparagine synthase (glutamine-hydrolysing)